MTVRNMRRTNRSSSDVDVLFQTVLSVTDALVEVYLKTAIQPFLQLHEAFYSRLNLVLRKAMDDNKENIPDWFTANFITYARTVLVFPCLMLIAWGHTLLPCIIVILVDFGDFWDGVAARYWIDVLREREQAKTATAPDAATTATIPRPNDDTFEIVTTGSPHSVLAWGVSHRQRSYGGFIDAICDKAFVVPCWIILLKTVPHSGYFHTIQFVALCALITAEISSACIRFRAYFAAGGVAAPKVEGFDFSTSAVKADHIGKAKQTFEMVGTAFYVIPWTRYIGLILLLLAIPLAYESVRRKVKKRVIYVNGDVPQFDHRTLKFWMQAKAMGSKLIVGIPGSKNKDKILNACAASCVDEVIAEAPVKADLMFLEHHDIDYVVLGNKAQAPFVTEEVVKENCCLLVDDAGVARLFEHTKQE